MRMRAIDAAKVDTARFPNEVVQYTTGNTEDDIGRAVRRREWSGSSPVAKIGFI